MSIKKVFSAFHKWEPGEVIPCKSEKGEFSALWWSLSQKAAREEKTKSRKEPELDGRSSLWSSKDITVEWKRKPQEGRRYRSAYNWQRAYIGNTYKQIRDNPVEEWAGLINRPSQKGLSKCSTSSVMREMQWKQIGDPTIGSAETAKIKKTDHTHVV